MDEVNDILNLDDIWTNLEASPNCYDINDCLCITRVAILLLKHLWMN